ncbi:hypothetical protein C9J12_19780 [Photobacterium frigidiphilum]|uniref:Outer membrane protein beta-barrel domain-containing protein n=1 Tax=Photobacterium frigidiphilum TaxID=264736 RepID=A0A2T3JB65_9GAMM|nr:hypothetical protein [Photobacterium frigidiphilum]PSU46099.1 hypothetical protein C9J12_19780 [Photobacterium frigidiphilum]
MKKLLITLALLVVALPTIAAENNAFLGLIGDEHSSSGWFMTSQSNSIEQFDLWQIDSGYSYSLNGNLQFYLSTRLSSGNDTKSASRGVLSGVAYNLSPKVSLQSAVTSEVVERDTVYGVEITSQYDVTDKVNLRATVDYEALEQIYQLGIGFRF